MVSFRVANHRVRRIFQHNWGLQQPTTLDDNLLRWSPVVEQHRHCLNHSIHHGDLFNALIQRSEERRVGKEWRNEGMADNRTIKTDEVPREKKRQGSQASIIGTE